MNVQMNLFGPPDVTLPKSNNKTRVDYLFSIMPPEKISRDISNLSSEFCDFLNIPKNDPSTCKMFSLTSIRYNTAKDERIIRKLKSILSRTEAFPIETNECDFLNYSHSCDVVLRTKESEPTTSLITTICREFGIPEISQRSAANVIIARGLNREQKVKVEKEKYNYYSKFECSRVTLLRREVCPRNTSMFSTIAEVKLY